MLVTAILVGVIATIPAPSFLGLLNRNRVNSALNRVHIENWSFSQIRFPFAPCPCILN